MRPAARNQSGWRNFYILHSWCHRAWMFFRSRLRKTTCIFPATIAHITRAHSHTCARTSTRMRRRRASVFIKSSKSVEHACWFGSHQLCFTALPPSAAWVNTHTQTCTRTLSCLRVKWHLIHCSLADSVNVAGSHLSVQPLFHPGIAQ